MADEEVLMNVLKKGGEEKEEKEEKEERKEKEEGEAVAAVNLLGGGGVQRRRLNGRGEVEKERKRRRRERMELRVMIICIIVIILVGIALVAFFAWCPKSPFVSNSTDSTSSFSDTELLPLLPSTTTTTTALPITQPLLHCALSEIPSFGNVTSSHPFGRLEKSEWKEGIVFLPCSNAIGYNKALMDQLNNEMGEGLWKRDEDGTLMMKNQTAGKDKFMKSFIQFVVSFAGLQDKSVTVDELIRYFGKDFEKIKCLKIRREELPQSLPCIDAAFTDSLTDEERMPFPKSPRAFMGYIQSKVLLFTIFLGEIKDSLINVVSQGTATEFFDGFFPLAKANDRPGMIKFLNERTINEIAEIAMAASRILDKISRCMEKLNPIPGQTWKRYFSEQCLHFADSINWNDILNQV